MGMRSLAIGLALAFALPVAADAFEATTTSPVNVRSGAGSKYTRLATLPLGTSVWVDSCNGGWCAINAGGVTGWISARYLSGAGSNYSYRPPSFKEPAIPRYVPPLVVPRKDYHYYGYSRQHKFQRPFD